MNVSTENYLKILFMLQRTHLGYVKTSSLAKRLTVAPSSVTEMVKKLADKGLLTYSPYKGVRLTDSGLNEGRNMVRRHRIIELFLHDVLGVSWTKVHQEAEQLEHVVSDDLINRMEKVLDFPKYDPHGDPIPSKEGVIPDQGELIMLKDAELGLHYKVVRVLDEGEDFLTFVEKLGLYLNQRVKVVSILSFDQSLELETGSGNVQVSGYVAKHIWVSKLSDREVCA